MWKRLSSRSARSGKANIRFRRGDGSYAYVLDRALILYDGQAQPVRMLGGMLDITAMKDAEQRVRQSELKYRNLLDQASDAIFTTDLDANLLECNTPACRLLGVTCQQLRGRNLGELIPEWSRGQDPLIPEEVLRGKTVLVERYYCRKDGRPVPVESSMRRASDSTIQVIARDVTERKLTERAH